MNLEVLKPFTKQTGEILRFSELFIHHRTGEIKYKYFEHPVLLSNGENIVYLGRFDKLSLIDQKKKKKREGSNNYAVVNEVYVHKEHWGIRCMESDDGLYARCYSFSSKKVNDRRVKIAMEKFVEKEYGFYSAARTALKEFEIPKG